MKKIIAAILLASIISAIIIISALPGDEKRVIKTITKGCTAIEEEDIDKLMSVLSLSYRDEFGLAYMHVRKSFNLMFEQFSGIKVGCRLKNIEIRGDTAVAVCDIWTTGKIQGQRFRIIASNADPQQLTLTLAKGEFSWKVTASKWRSFPVEEALFSREFHIPSPSRP